MKTILAIDPSINHVGWASYRSEVWQGGTYDMNINKQSRIPSLISNCYLLAKFLKDRNQTLDLLIVEKPTFMSSAKGQIASQRGYTLDLAFINGYIISHFTQNYFNPVVIEYTPQQWKGTVPKSATLAKFKRLFPTIDANKLTDHEIDARMIIQHYLTKK